MGKLQCSFRIDQPVGPEEVHPSRMGKFESDYKRIDLIYLTGCILKKARKHLIWWIGN